MTGDDMGNQVYAVLKRTAEDRATWKPCQPFKSRIYRPTSRETKGNRKLVKIAYEVSTYITSAPAESPKTPLSM